MSVKTNENKLMTEGSIARQIFFLFCTFDPWESSAAAL